MLVDDNYPLSSTNNDSHVRSLLRRSRLPIRELGSTSMNPSTYNAFLAEIQSEVATLSRGVRGSSEYGRMTLFSDRSSATIKAIDMYVEVSSSAQCSPAEIHGTHTIKARTISTDLYRFATMRLANFCR